MPYFTTKVPADYTAHERLDRYIASLPDGMNRSKLKSSVVEVLVNDKVEKLSVKLKANDRIRIEWEENIPDNIEPEDIPLSILYEDDDVCVVDKAQGMVTHPACGNWSGTLVNALLFHWNRERIPQLTDGTQEEILKHRRPGIVHRLDKETSGIIITAKNRDAETWLGAQFREHGRLVKEYIAICMGRPQHQHGLVETQIIRDSKNRKRFRAVTDTEEGKRAKTFYNCLACYGEYSLLRIRIATGRTHQIRVHLRYLNCPVLGDSLYGRVDKNFPDATLMLHAHLLKIRLPKQKAYSIFSSPTPRRFLQVLRSLHAQYPKTILPRDR